MRICKTLGSGFTRLWERICEDLQGSVKTLGEETLWRGFMRIHRICETLGEDW